MNKPKKDAFELILENEKILRKVTYISLTGVHLVEIIKRMQAGDTDFVLQEFAKYSGKDLLSTGYEWKEENPQEYSDFLQQLMLIIPTDTPLSKVFTILSDYLLAIVHLPPAAPDLAVQAALTFLARREEAEGEEWEGFLHSMILTPDAEKAQGLIETTRSELVKYLPPHNLWAKDKQTVSDN